MEKLTVKIENLFDDALFRNSFYLMLSTGVMAICGFVFWLLVAHLYQPSEVGVAATIITSMNFIAYFSLLGFNSTFIRFLPNSRKRSSQINTGLILVCIAAILIAGIYTVVASHFSKHLEILHSNTYYSIAFILLCLSASVNLVTDSIFIAYRSAKYNLLIDGIIGSLTQLALPTVLISLGAFGIFAAQGFAALVAMICSITFLCLRFHYQPRLKIDHQTLQELFRYSSGNYLINLLNVSPTIILPIIVLHNLGAAAAGYYYLAFMMANLLFTIAYSISQSLFAEGSYKIEDLRHLVKRAAIMLVGIITPAAMTLMIIGPFILKMFGKSYSSDARNSLMIFAIAAPFVAGYILGCVILRIQKRIKTLILVNSFYVLIIGFLAYIWSTKGLAWVAIAWLVGHALTGLLILAILSYRHYGLKISVRPKRANRLTKPLAAPYDA